MALKSFNQGTLNTVSNAQGLVHINTTTFSGVSAVSLPNGTFSSSYKNYRILFDIQSASATLSFIQARMRSAGTDRTANVYYSTLQGLRATNVTSNVLRDTVSSWYFSVGSIGERVKVSFDLYNPFDASYQTFAIGNSWGDDGSYSIGYNLGAAYYASNSDDSMSFIATSSNMTGVVRVYGYKD